MTPLFKKLNFKDHQDILVINAPDSFEEELSSMSSFAPISTEWSSKDTTQFCMVFVTKKSEIDEGIGTVFSRLEGDAVLWYCYPKKSSKKYKCDFNRDNGWRALGDYDLEGVRQVAIDEDWSALRFRKIEFIKSFKRDKSRALSKKGKSRKN